MALSGDHECVMIRNINCVKHDNKQVNGEHIT